MFDCCKVIYLLSFFTAHRIVSRPRAARRLGPFPHPAWTDVASSAESWWRGVCTTVQRTGGFLTWLQMDSWWGTRGEFLMYHLTLWSLLFSEVVLEWDTRLTLGRVWIQSSLRCAENETFTSANEGHAVVQVVRHWPLSVEDFIPFQVPMQDLCWAKCWDRFLSEYFGFPLSLSF